MKALRRFCKGGVRDTNVQAAEIRARDAGAVIRALEATAKVGAGRSSAESQDASRAATANAYDMPRKGGRVVSHLPKMRRPSSEASCREVSQMGFLLLRANFTSSLAICAFGG